MKAKVVSLNPSGYMVSFEILNFFLTYFLGGLRPPGYYEGNYIYLVVHNFLCAL